MSDKMKIIMGGWKGSKRVISACSFLLQKYLPEEFDVYFLNIGEFNGDLPRGQYVNLGEVDDSPQGWIKNMGNYLGTLTDEFVILGDDDFFLSKPVDMNSYKKLFTLMGEDETIGCAKLCPSLFHKPSEYTLIDSEIFKLNSSAEWSSVVQFTLWRRDLLIQMLKLAFDPWEFERAGSERLNNSGKSVICAFNSPFIYPDRSALSQTHPDKVNVLGNSVEDVEELIKLGYLNRDELVMGMWGGSVKTYEKGKNNQEDCLENCADKKYAKLMLRLCLDKKESKIESFSGALFRNRIDTNDRNLVAYVFERNHYKLPENMEGTVLVDVGANIGTASILAAKQGATVYAIEPYSENFKILEDNIVLNHLNGKIHASNIGIGKGEEAILYFNNERPDWCGLSAEMNNLDLDNNEKVKLTTLKTFFDKHNIEKCHFLKMDAEGAEHDIIDDIEAGLHTKIERIGCELHNYHQTYKEILERFLQFYGIEHQLTEYEYVLHHK